MRLPELSYDPTPRPAEQLLRALGRSVELPRPRASATVRLWLGVDGRWHGQRCPGGPADSTVVGFDEVPALANRHRSGKVFSPCPYGCRPHYVPDETVSGWQQVLTALALHDPPAPTPSELRTAAAYRSLLHAKAAAGRLPDVTLAAEFTAELDDRLGPVEVTLAAARDHPDVWLPLAVHDPGFAVRLEGVSGGQVNLDDVAAPAVTGARRIVWRAGLSTEVLDLARRAAGDLDGGTPVALLDVAATADLTAAAVLAAGGGRVLAGHVVTTVPPTVAAFDGIRSRLLPLGPIAVTGPDAAATVALAVALAGAGADGDELAARTADAAALTRLG